MVIFNVSTQSLLEPNSLADIRVLKKVFKIGKHINARDSLGLTYLHMSVLYQQEKLTKYLIKNNCNINAQDKIGKTPLMVAVRCQYTRMMEILLKAGADMFIEDFKNRNILFDFFKFHREMNREFCYLFLDELRRRCSSHDEMMRKLYDVGGDLLLAIWRFNADRIENLIQNGVSVNRVDHNKVSPLHLAALTDQADAVKVLVKYGADVNALDNRGCNALAFMKFYHQTPQEIEILQTLLDNGISTMSLTVKGEFQIKNALKHGTSEAIGILLKSNGIDFTARDARNNTVLHLLSLNFNDGVTEELRNYADQLVLNLVNRINRTPLLSAIINDNLKMIKFLLDMGADTNIVHRTHHMTPIFYSIVGSKYIKEHEETTELLLQNNADPQFVTNTQDDRPFTVFDIIKNCDDFDKAKAVIAHIVMLDMFGIPIKDIIRKKIHSRRAFRKYFKLCKQMLQTNITESVTVFTLLFVSKKKLSKYLSKRQFVCQLKRLSYRQNIKTDFSYYWNTLTKRITEGSRHGILRYKGSKSLANNIIKKVHETDLAVENIIDYLNDKDLENLVEAYKDKSNQTRNVAL